MISPSIACANYLKLYDDITELDRAKVDLFHIDIMDGHLVPNICLNFDIVKQVSTISQIPTDVHLMVTNPFDYIDIMKERNVKYACTHLSSVESPLDFLSAVRSAGMLAGIVINPDEDIEQLLPILPNCDYILVMGVKPGFSGQKFMPIAFDNVSWLKAHRDELGLDFLIEIDGGLDFELSRTAMLKGADIVVGGVFSVFNQPEGIYGACQKLREMITVS